MILRRCEKGHYYDGEIYKECPSCKGTGQNARMPDMSYGDYADEDAVTVALPRSHGHGLQAGRHASDGEDFATMALPRKKAAAASAVRKPTFKPVVGWLVCIRGDDFGSSFTVRLGKNYIGRSPDMDIVLHGDDSIAMERHAAIYYVPKQGRFAVEPGTSGKRSCVNRNTVERPAWIKQHDILHFGNSSFIFCQLCGEHFSWEELIRRQRERN